MIDPNRHVDRRTRHILICNMCVCARACGCFCVPCAKYQARRLQLGWCPKASLISWAIIFMLLDSLVIFALHLPIYFPPFCLAILAFLAFTLYGMLCLSLYVRPIAWFMAPSIAPLLSHCGRTVWCAHHNAPKLHCWVYCIAGAIDAGLRQGQRSWVLLTHWRRDQRQRNRMLRKHVRTWLWRRILWGQRDGECCIAT